MFERMAPEQHDTLPDIPEPIENPLLLGHAEAAAMLAASYQAGKLHHAVLLAGRRGIGKATLAFHIAHHVLTHLDHRTAPSELARIDPQSRAFRLAAQGAHPGILHLTRPYADREKKFRTVITVEEIRRVNRFLSLTPPDGGYRFIIVDPAEDMNISAANALLKNLEEPPPRTVFFLIAHSLGRLLPTIRSRCQVIKLQPLPDLALERLLAALGAQLPENPHERQFLVERSSGSARDAILLTQFGGLEITGAIDTLLAARQFEVAAAYRLAEATVGREREVQFDIFNRTILDRLAERASEAAGSGGVSRAARLANLWENTAETIRQVEIFNLDRKQHVVGTMARLHEAMQGELAG